MKTSIFQSKLLFALALLIISAIQAAAQTSQFTYQGKLSNTGGAANGTFEMQFRLYNAASGGAQIGATVTNASVSVAQGSFTVQLDFGVSAFDGADRFLEIGVRPSGSANAFTLLAPRQQITSAPYAIRSLNAANANTATDSAQLGGTAANQFVQTTDARLSDARSPTAGSANYIQNTTTQQAGANFNIGSTGAANIFNARTQYNIGDNRVLSVPGSQNLFAGISAGNSNTTGFYNSFFGNSAGSSNTTGSDNSFVGSGAGSLNTTGNDNSFVGYSAGYSNTTGKDNSFVGSLAGGNNTTGAGNSFIGTRAGFINTTGSNNSFVGKYAGYYNTTGESNSFFGKDAGLSNTTGNFNSFVGASAGLSNTTGESNSFIGDGAGQSNTTGSSNSFVGILAGNSNTTGNYNLFAGALAGQSNTTGGSNSFVGPEAGKYNTTGGGNSFVGANAGFNNTTGSDNLFVGYVAGYRNTTGYRNAFFGYNAGTINTIGNSNLILGYYANVGSDNLDHATAIGAEAVVYTSNTVVLGRSASQDLVYVPGLLSVGTLGSAGNVSLCRNAAFQISPCSSSLRYKTNIASFSFGLNVVNQLRPISFDWKEGGMKDVGFGAEDVAKINPLFVTYNDKGKVEGVKYDRLSVAFVNAFKEQQAQIESQQQQIKQQNQQIKRQQQQIDGLQKIVCGLQPTAKICRQKK